jgi:hypothetical protein
MALWAPGFGGVAGKFGRHGPGRFLMFGRLCARLADCANFGEAGSNGDRGAAAAVANAVNDALAPFGMMSFPPTPEIVLPALGRI